jgi:hypothetical protein
MNDDTVTDALLREFLLGNITGEERERIESLFLIDPQTRERVLGVEQDLIEDYLEGTLSTEDRETFVSRYAQTAEQRRKLRITKSIKEWAKTEAATAQAVPVRSSAWSRLLERLRLKPSFVIPIAVTALIVIVVAAIWLSRRTAHSAIERELAQLNAPSNTAAPSFQRELLPVTVRSAGPADELIYRPDKGEIELRLLLIQKDRYSSYHAAIHRVDDRESYAVSNLPVSSDGKSIRLRLPAHFLTRGVYHITLTPEGFSSSGDEYQFTIGS